MTQSAGAPRARDIAGLVNIGFIRRLGARIGELHLPAFAAGLAYGAVFALLPTLALLVLLLGVFNATELVDRGVNELSVVLPADATDLIDEQLTSIAQTEDQDSFGIAVMISAGVALWGASGAMRRIMEALNVVHGADETRGFVRKLLVSFAMAIGAIVMLAATLVAAVLGSGAAERAFDVVGLGAGAETVWLLLRWPVLLVTAWLGIAAAYRFGPAARRTGGLLTPGTIFAVGGWAGFSLLFSWYVGGIGDMSASWGSVAGVIVFLLYLQYAGLIVLVGALIDVELYEADRPSSTWRRRLHMPASKH